MIREDLEMRVREWKSGYNQGKVDGMKAAWMKLLVYIFLGTFSGECLYHFIGSFFG